MYWWRRSTLELCDGELTFGSLIWRDELPVPYTSPANCLDPDTHEADPARCGCGYYFATRDGALAYPGAGTAPLLQVLPRGRVIGSAGGGRSERLEVLSVSFAAVCSLCLTPTEDLRLEPVAAPPRSLLVSVCPGCATAASMALPSSMTGTPVALLDAEVSEQLRQQTVADLAGCHGRKAWWVLRAVHTAAATRS